MWEMLGVLAGGLYCCAASMLFILGTAPADHPAVRWLEPFSPARCRWLPPLCLAASVLMTVVPAALLVMELTRGYD